VNGLLIMPSFCTHPRICVVNSIVYRRVVIAQELPAAPLECLLPTKQGYRWMGIIVVSRDRLATSIRIPVPDMHSTKTVYYCNCSPKETQEDIDRLPPSAAVAVPVGYIRRAVILPSKQEQRTRRKCSHVFVVCERHS
jgi:hypothetical protein